MFSSKNVSEYNGRGKPRDFFHSFRLGAKESGRMPYIFMVLKSWPGRNNVDRKHSKSWIGVLKDSFVTGECALNTAFHCISNEPIFCMTGVEQRRAKAKHHLYRLEGQNYFSEANVF